MTAIPISGGVLKALAAGQATGDWKSFLICNDRGAPKALLANCLIDPAYGLRTQPEVARHVS
jgi:hypothetical protein